jgi:aryl-phospho-beta-D-glucosidase BglC (GH1 family)
MRIIISIFLFFIIFNGFILPQSGFISTRGRDILDTKGQPIILKGINLGNWLVPEGYMFKFRKTNSPHLIYELLNELEGNFKAAEFWTTYRENYITYEDIKLIKQFGFNSIRLPFNYRLFVSECNGNKLEGPGYQLLDNAIEWCRKENLYVILDMHCAPGGQTGDNIDDSYGYPFLFENKEAQELTSRIWGKLASKYANNPIVAGYDLLNEPIPPFFDTTNLNPKLEPLFRKLVNAVRETDTNHICFLGGAQWDSNFDVFGKPFDSKLVYTFHKYWTSPTKEVIQQYINFSIKYNVPIWMGESGENTDEWINAFRFMLEENNIGWCFWPYKKMDSERGIVSVDQPVGYSEIIKFAESDRSDYEKIRKNKPSSEIIETALNNYLENIKIKNCRVNNGYLKALELSK